MYSCLAQVIAREYLGKVTPVSVADVDKKANRFVVNMIEALNNIAYEKIQVRLTALLMCETTMPSKGCSVAPVRFPHCHGIALCPTARVFYCAHDIKLQSSSP